jgi:hypothetical protein
MYLPHWNPILIYRLRRLVNPIFSTFATWKIEISLWG